MLDGLSVGSAEVFAGVESLDGWVVMSQPVGQ
jgi:hypothetical protein